jgi:hypothetical protein
MLESADSAIDIDSNHAMYGIVVVQIWPNCHYMIYTVEAASAADIIETKYGREPIAALPN